MYSMVLMAALTTGTDMPDWGRRWGCHGCWGGWGWGCHGCWGGWGYGWGGWGGWGGYGWGGWGGWGGYPAWGYAYAPVATYAAPAVVVSNTLPTTAPTAVTRSMYPDTSASNRATIIVHLPEAAALTVDGKPTTSTSATRRFYSPPLEPGKSYHYTFQARMERDGKEVKADQRVDVRAGDRREITITMPDLNQAPERQQTAAPDKRKGIRDRRFQVDRH